jgi:SAM-dependent methyltransferase
VTGYRERIWEKIRELVEPLRPLQNVLDFGSGDGFFASRWKNALAATVTAVDVVERKTSLVAPTLYDGERLPFADGSFDLTYAVDVLHHCRCPLSAISDMSRCSRRFLLVKDHTYQGTAGKLTLAVLDEIGNRRFGIPSLYLYQRNWAWVERIESNGWRRLALLHPLRCHTGILGAITNDMQFLGLWERVHA